MFSNNNTQHRYNNCDHTAKLIIRNRIASIKTGKRKEQKNRNYKKRLNIHGTKERKGKYIIKYRKSE